MKHVFFVHSHITFILSKLIINKYVLLKKDIVFIVSRNYKNEELAFYDSINFSQIHDELSKYYIKDFFKIYSYIEKIDHVIESKIDNKEFIVYLPIVRHKLMQIIASHKNCICVNIVEEGMTSYSDYFFNDIDSNIFKRIGKFIFNNLFFLTKERFFYIKPFELRYFNKNISSKFYTISKLGFNGVKEEIVYLNFKEYNKKCNYDIDNNTPILILEGAVEQGNLSIDILEEAVDQMISSIDYNKIYVKFHPVQSIETINLINQIFKKYNKQIIKIPKEISIELLSLDKKLIIYGFSSSLLFYTKLFGSEVYSYEYLLLKDYKYKKFKKQFNFDIVNLLDKI